VFIVFIFLFHGFASHFSSPPSVLGTIRAPAGRRQRLVRRKEHPFISAFKIPDDEFETAFRKVPGRVWRMAPSKTIRGEQCAPNL
jgi:hypothetical protein